MNKKLEEMSLEELPNIRSKNIVDILLEVTCEDDLSMMKDTFLKSGWLCMSENQKRISMNKGYTPVGFASKVFHLHIRLAGDNDELYFRDYLLEHPDIAKEYEKLKMSLASKYKHNRDGYTEAKSDFISKYTSIAKNCYYERYK